MTTRVEKLEGAVNTVGLKEPTGDLLFLRFGRSADYELSSIAIPLARSLRKQGYVLREESIVPNDGLIETLIRLIRFAQNYRTVHLFFEHGTSKIGFALPAIILARFFGCQVILSFLGPVDDPPFGRMGRLKRQCLHLCNLITVQSGCFLKLLEKYKVKVRKLTPVIETTALPKSDYSTIVPTVLVTLSLEESSNISSAIRAVELVKQKYPRARLVVLGNGSQKARLETISSAINHGAIEIVTRYSQRLFDEYLNDADIYLCSSLDNNLPISLIHALHSGTPVVAVANTAILELLTDGVNGLLTDQGDHIALAEKLFQLVESKELRSELAERGRLVAEKLDCKKTREEWYSLYA